MDQTTSHGCHPAHNAARPTEILTDEHRVIERVLAALERLIVQPVGESLEQWRKALQFFRHFADQCHHFKEENVLFPAMEARGIPRDGGPIGMMLIEHEEGRAHVRSMFDAAEQVADGHGAAAEILFRRAGAYVTLLREHIQKEDDILFRMADEVIPDDEQRRLLKRFEDFELEDAGNGLHEKYLDMAMDLYAWSTKTT